MAINVLILGRRSELANELIESFDSDFNYIHASLRDGVEFIKDRLQVEFGREAFVMMDFTVYSSRRNLREGVRLIKSLAPSRCFVLSTQMHGRESSPFLSSYRKLKLRQESAMASQLADRVTVIRLPDVIDSRAWLSHRAPDGVYRFRSYKSSRQELLGAAKTNVLANLIKYLREETAEIIADEAFILEVERVTALKVRLKAGLKLWLSRSLMASDVRVRLKKGGASGKACEGRYAKVDLAGGFADLV